jgi:NADPH-dependent 2,4-dienoyl-CoA reductase/sulfur reductase-like enzyme/nitrite reductase/ring-hydroxylating ferredoxin subunit
MGEWMEIARRDELEENGWVVKQWGEDEILLLERGGEVLAYGHKCPHYGAPLSEGVEHDGHLVCPWHNSIFALEDGALEVPPALDDLPRYAVDIDQGAIYVKHAEKPMVSYRESTRDQTFVIAGGGGAGNAAAETLRREGFEGKIVMITPEQRLPYDRPNLSKMYLAGQAKPTWLPLRSKSFYEERSIDVMEGRRAVGVERGERKVVLDDSTRVSYDKLLLATGAAPNQPDTRGAKRPNVFTLRSWADADDIIKAAKKAKRAVVLGGSFIGLEVAASLRERGVDVDVVEIQKAPLRKAFGDRVGRRFQKLHESKGVRFHLETTAKEIRGETQVQQVALQNGETIDADMVIAGLGVRPVVDYLEESGLVEDGAVDVSSTLQTADPDIFAAGDLARFPDPHTGERLRIEHWVVAESQGMHAARSMLGEQKSYTTVPFFWTRQFATPFKHIGYGTDHDRVAFRGDVDGGDFTAGYYKGGRLKAASTLGRTGELVRLMSYLRHGETIPFDQFPSVDLKP